MWYCPRTTDTVVRGGMVLYGFLRQEAMFKNSVCESVALSISLLEQALEMASNTEVRLESYDYEPGRITRDNNLGFEYRTLVFTSVHFLYRNGSGSDVVYGSFIVHLAKDKRWPLWVPSGQNSPVIVTSNGRWQVEWVDYDPRPIHSKIRLRELVLCGPSTVPTGRIIEGTSLADRVDKR